jgi:hypothetical protein
VTKPISNSNLNHWRLSPFADNFEERVQPAPLSVNDERIVERLASHDSFNINITSAVIG